MKPIIWIGAIVVTVVYVALVYLVGYEGRIALVFHFARLAISPAVLILYLPKLREIFHEIPSPRRDYLVAGIVLTWGSGEGFSTLNLLANAFGTNWNNVFTNPVAGYCSLMLIAGGILHWVVPQTSPPVTRREAMLLGVLIAVGMVLFSQLYG